MKNLNLQGGSGVSFAGYEFIEASHRTDFNFVEVDRDYRIAAVDAVEPNSVISSSSYLTVEKDSNGLWQIYSSTLTTPFTKTKLTTLGNNYNVATNSTNIFFTSDRGGLAEQWVMGMTGSNQVRLFPRSDIVCWGDSLTNGASGGFAGPYPSQLSGLFGNTRRIYSMGVPGASSTGIANRQGGTTLTVNTVAGNSIPASGAVNITVSNNFFNSRKYYLKGSLAGIPGNIIYNGTTYQFLRDDDGSAVAVTPPLTYTVDPIGLDQMITVIWAGRNDFATPATVKTNIANMISFLKPLNKRYVVLSILNSTNTGERQNDPDPTLYNTIIQLNNDLAALYPNNYVDVRTALVNAYNPALPQDVLDFNSDLVPASLRTDFVHLTPEGYGIVAQQIFNFITARGW